MKPPRLEILVADDDSDTVEAFALLLRGLGHDVRTAQNGAQVVQAVATRRPDLIFLDIGMPDQDGWALAQAIRAQLGQDTVRIVAVTGRGGREDFLKSRKSGFDAHVVKPVEMALLQSILQHFQEPPPAKVG